MTPNCERRSKKKMTAIRDKHKVDNVKIGYES